jgi:DNA (cytosine-5)-methyltransferase 1
MEAARLVGELEPRGLLLENVSALLGRGLGDVLGTLASFGYDAEWHCIPASYAGLPHDRDRIWILAHPSSDGLQGFKITGKSRKVREIAAEQLARSLEAHSRLSSPTGRMGGRVDGLPGGVDRLKQLGNAVVPQIPELIGRAILAAEAAA